MAKKQNTSESKKQIKDNTVQYNENDTVEPNDGFSMEQLKMLKFLFENGSPLLKSHDFLDGVRGMLTNRGEDVSNLDDSDIYKKLGEILAEINGDDEAWEEKTMDETENDRWNPYLEGGINIVRNVSAIYTFYDKASRQDPKKFKLLTQMINRQNNERLFLIQADCLAVAKKQATCYLSQEWQDKEDAVFKLTKGDHFVWVSGKDYELTKDNLLLMARTPEEIEAAIDLVVGYPKKDFYDANKGYYEDLEGEEYEEWYSVRYANESYPKNQQIAKRYVVQYNLNGEEVESVHILDKKNFKSKVMLKCAEKSLEDVDPKDELQEYVADEYAADDEAWFYKSYNSVLLAVIDGETRHFEYGEWFITDGNTDDEGISWSNYHRKYVMPDIYFPNGHIAFYSQDKKSIFPPMDLKELAGLEDLAGLE